MLINVWLSVQTKTNYKESFFNLINLEIVLLYMKEVYLFPFKYIYIYIN